MAYKLHRTTGPYLTQVKRHTKPYEIKVSGIPLLVYPGVMSPKYDWSGSFHVRKLPVLKGKDFLELGCGSGIVSVAAAIRGARKVVAVDINKAAVANTDANFKLHKLKAATVLHSNLFAKIRGTFDVIVFNLPYHGNKPKNALEKGVADEGYKTMRRFLKEAGRYLKPKGELHVGFSTSGDTQLLRKVIAANNLKLHKLYSEYRKGYNCQIYILKKA